MPLRNTVVVLVTLTAIGVGAGHAGENRLRVDVSPRISMAPAAVRIRAIVTPDDANRALQIVADSPSFYRSSIVPLDGANAAAVTELTLKNLPGGEYDVIVVLVEADGRRTVDRRQITVTSLRE